MPQDYRPTEPVQAFEATVQLPPDDDLPPELPPELPPPERGPRRSSLVLVGVVVLVFMAVPLLANLATRSPERAKTPAASEPVATVQSPPPAAAPAPQRSEPAPVVPDRPAPTPARALPDPSRQMVTKCIEHGRVVYTQTGDCSGSVSAVPIDTGKNVVGPSRDATRP
jgi:hypothetical protein